MVAGENAVSHVLSRVLGYISGYTQMCSGRQIDTRNYFFNQYNITIVDETEVRPSG